MDRSQTSLRSARMDAVRGWSRAISILCATFALLAAVPVGAAVFPDLYRLTVMPDADAIAEHGREGAAERLAMRQLLVRITGNREPDADPALASLIDNATDYRASIGRLEGGQRWQVEFYPSEVDAALASLNRPVWGPERPLTLLWVAVDGGDGERALLSASSLDLARVGPEMAEVTAAIIEEIEAAADERGLPIAWPLLDLEDRTTITSADVWGAFEDRIQEASRRYRPDAILIGRVGLTPYGYSTRWTLLRGMERPRSFAGTDVAEGLHWTANTYAEDFSVLGGGARNVRIIVRGVASRDDYGRVMRYLQDLSALESVALESYDAGMLSLRATTRGDAGVLRQLLTLGRVLELDEGAPTGFNPSGAVAADSTLLLRIARGR